MASLFLFSFITLYLVAHPASSKVVLEEGYTVSTQVDFNKIHSVSDSGVHPYALLPRPQSNDLVLLDSSSSIFYILSLPSSQDEEPKVNLLAGNGKLGFTDGESKVASFNKPKSFTIDDAGNVYVADRLNNVIRKIDTSGFTTTIAGGKTRKIGNTDGPAQNASFSNEFELVYISKMCALLVVDRGNNLIRQINLNLKDCTNRSHQSGLGAAWVSIISTLCVLLGFVIGFIARPFLNIRGFSTKRQVSKTWRRFRTNQATPTQTIFSGVRNATVNKTLGKLIRLINNYISLVFYSIMPKREIIIQKENISLMDQDIVTMSNNDASFCESNGIKDLLCLSSVNSVSCNENEKIDDDVWAGFEENNNDSNRLDEMIRAHLSGFSKQVEQQGVVEESELLSGSDLVTHRKM